jgi:hypothetical protein
MNYKLTHPKVVMSTRTTKMLGVGIAGIVFLLVTIPVLKTGVAYADSDHDHDRDRDHHDHDDDDRHND